MDQDGFTVVVNRRNKRRVARTNPNAAAERRDAERREARLGEPERENQNPHVPLLQNDRHDRSALRTGVRVARNGAPAGIRNRIPVEVQNRVPVEVQHDERNENARQRLRESADAAQDPVKVKRALRYIAMQARLRWIFSVPNGHDVPGESFIFALASLLVQCLEKIEYYCTLDYCKNYCMDLWRNISARLLKEGGLLTRYVKHITGIQRIDAADPSKYEGLVEAQDLERPMKFFLRFTRPIVTICSLLWKIYDPASEDTIDIMRWPLLFMAEEVAVNLILSFPVMSIFRFFGMISSESHGEWWFINMLKIAAIRLLSPEDIGEACGADAMEDERVIINILASTTFSFVFGHWVALDTLRFVRSAKMRDWLKVFALVVGWKRSCGGDSESALLLDSRFCKRSLISMPAIIDRWWRMGAWGVLQLCCTFAPMLLLSAATTEALLDAGLVN